MQPLEVSGVGINKINGAIDLKLWATSGAGLHQTVHMSYGDYTKGRGGLGLRSRVDADIEISVENIVTDNVGNMAFDVHARYFNFHRSYVNTNGAVLPLHIHIYASQDRANEVTVIHDNTSGSSKQYGDVNFTYNVYLPCNTDMYVGVGRYWNDLDRTNIDDEFNGGIWVRNPNQLPPPPPPDYRPGSRLIGGEEMSHNRDGGHCDRMLGGPVEMRTIKGHEESGNPPEVMAGGPTNQYKLGKE